MGKDYSEYIPSKTELYFIQRKGNKYISMDTFRNLVKFYPEDRKIHILVDSYYEQIFRSDDIAEDERMDSEHREIHPDILSPEEVEEREKQRQDSILENKEDYAAFRERFVIDRSEFDERVGEEYKQRGIENPFPLNNILSGADIHLQYGEGLLDFIYADFEPELQRMIGWARSWRMLADQFKEKNPEEVKALQGQFEELGDTKVYCHAQDDDSEYFRFVYTMRFAKKIMHCALFNTICPPIFRSDRDADQALTRYAGYLKALQDEYREMVEFCFDGEFWPDVLHDLHAVDRFSLYRRLKDLPSSFQRTEDWSFSMSRMGGEEPPYGLPVEKLKELFSTPIETGSAHEKFAREYGVDLDILKGLLKFPRFLNIQYEFRSVRDILELEFSKMLETNIRLAKDKESGRYVL